MAENTGTSQTNEPVTPPLDEVVHPHGTNTDETGDNAEDRESIGESIARLIAAGKELVEAELSWAKLKAALVAAALQRAALFGVLALILVTIALFVLVSAAVIALAPLVGWLAASLIVAAILLALAALLGLMARRAISSINRRDI